MRRVFAFSEGKQSWLKLSHLLRFALALSIITSFIRRQSLIFENSDVFGAEYWLDIEGPGRLTQLTFTDKAKALRVYREECESKLDFV